MSKGRVLHRGSVSGLVLRLGSPLSFWGGFDPASGRIIDRSHPDVGVSLTSRVVAMPGSRGSSGTPGVLAESLRLGTGPAGLLVTKADVNLTAGAVVAVALYDTAMPIVQVDHDWFDRLLTGQTVTIAPDGSITVG